MDRAFLSVAVLLVTVGHGISSPQDAVVRIPSHGCSGMVIASRQGESWLLTCGHAFQGRDRYKRIALDVPSPQPGQPARVGVNLVAVDYQADLALIRIGTGPLPYVIPVAPAGYVPGVRLLSCGYDAMRGETVRPATLVGSEDGITFTRENPLPGRSGGALLDADSGYLLGTVIGYEVTGPRRGMYTSHGAICQFLQTQGWGQQPATNPIPTPSLPIPTPTPAPTPIAYYTLPTYPATPSLPIYPQQQQPMTPAPCPGGT